MNTEQKAIEPFILPSDEMFTQIIAAPEKYPILVFHPKLSPKKIKRHTQTFHVYPVEHRGEMLHGTVYGYYKKMPISAKQPKRLKAYKEKINVPNVSNPFDTMIETPDGNEFFLFQQTLPKIAIDEMAKTFWVAQLEHQGEMRRGVLCVYLKPTTNLPNNPLAENEVRIIGAWEE